MGTNRVTCVGRNVPATRLLPMDDTRQIELHDQIPGPLSGPTVMKAGSDVGPGSDIFQRLLKERIVFIGSAIWWLLLSGGVSLVRHKLKPETMRWINYGSGAFLSAFGIYALVSLAF